MTTLAKDARPGPYYRLTRDPGSSYYMISRPGAVQKLTKRVSAKDPLLLSPEDRRLVQALALCRDKGHVLALRGTRYIDDHGQRREMRAYVAFPPDYPLRAVAKLPGYKPKEKKVHAEREDDVRRKAS